MNNLPWKKIGLGTVAIAIVAFAVFYFQNAKSKSPFGAGINPAFGEHITSYTAGIVGSGSTVRIILSENAVDSLEIGQEASAKLFEFSPAIDGKATWLDRRTVEFQPSARLTSGQMYEVDFFLSKLVNDLPSDLRTFKYTFQVIPQNFEVSIQNIKPYVKTELTKQMIEGTVNTADYATEEAVEKMLTANQEGNQLSVKWSHTAEGKQHVFIVENVKRKEKASSVKLDVSGSSLGINHSTQQDVEIPALSDFKVTNVRVEAGTTQVVILQFSDPLSETQNLEGLVNISELPDLDFEIKDNEVHVYPPVRQTGSRTLTVESGIRNVLNYRMPEGATFEVAFEQLNPAVRFTGNGTILPSSDGLVMPFEAVNLKSVFTSQ
jgi:alpha-2-macroglobulin